MERSTAIAEQHRKVARAPICGGKIEDPVLVEVGYRYAEWVRTSRDSRGGLEGSVSDAQEYADTAGSKIRDSKIRFAILVQIRNRDRGRAGSHCVVCCSLERAIAIAEQYRN